MHPTSNCNSYHRHVVVLAWRSIVSPSRRNIQRDIISTRSISSRTSRHLTSEGRTTQKSIIATRSPYYFETAFSIFAKRPTRPFPPPFVSYPSGSFSDPLTTHNRPQYRQPKVDDEPLRGITNGDDAIIIDTNLLAVNDGVGAWAQKERGHAALWSRLIAHYWTVEAESAYNVPLTLASVDPVAWLDGAFERTKRATNAGAENQIMGTTTACSAILHHNPSDMPVVLATSLGDCAVMVVRPGNEELVYRSKEDWHWFDCPRQLGTNSPDTPRANSLLDVIDVQVGDLVLCVSDGVTDNLWDEEVVHYMNEVIQKWDAGEKEAEDGIVYCARTLMQAARDVALDPYAGSPYMSRAVDEGLAAEGGKLDDISVVVGRVRKHEK